MADKSCFESIGNDSFQGTKLVLDSIYFPRSLTTIRGTAFSGANLKDIYIPISVKVIEGGVFYGSNKATFYYEGSSTPST